MVDEVQSGVSTESSQAPEVTQSTSNEAPAAPVTETKPAPAEKMVPSSQVSKIVAQQSREAAEKARREAYADFERQKGASSTDNASSQNGVGGMPAQDDDRIRQLIQQEAWKMSNEAMAERIAKDFESKMDVMRAEDPEFDSKYKALNIEQHPELVLWTREMDNVGHVIRDIADNPTKFAQVLMLANSGFPQLAQQELQKLSSSIKANKAAQATPEVPEPLSQFNASSIGGADNGNLEVKDFRKQPWLRG